MNEVSQIKLNECKSEFNKIKDKVEELGLFDISRKQNRLAKLRS